MVTLSGDKENKQIFASFGKPVMRRKLVKLSVGPLGPGSTTESMLPLGRFVNFTFSTCYPNKFTCASGHCVPLKYFFQLKANELVEYLTIDNNFTPGPGVMLATIVMMNPMRVTVIISTIHLARSLALICHPALVRAALATCPYLFPYSTFLL